MPNTTCRLGAVEVRVCVCARVEHFMQEAVYLDIMRD